MANKKKIGRNGGWYWFGDGTCMWTYGLSAAEKRAYAKAHNGIRYYTANDEDYYYYENLAAPNGRCSTTSNATTDMKM